MRILIVAMSESIHVARWLKQLTDQGWDIHLFPCMDTAHPHPDIRDLTFHTTANFPPGQIDPSIRLCRPPAAVAGCAAPARLAELVRRLEPDIVHSMEFQHCSYLTLDACRRHAGRFPTWAVSNWGSDIYLFGRLPAHAERIRDVLAHCDFYYCECCRDVKLARQFGFQGEVLPVFPVAGGFDLQRAAGFRRPGPTSARRVILLKGYQTFAGRALVGLHALRLCASDLRDGNYRVAIYSASADVALAAQLFSEETGVPIELLPHGRSHEDMLRMFGQARAYIGLSISDAISTSLLEAMIMGAFPIQSWTACADEWLVDRETGVLVPPEDPYAVAAALRRALTEDTLVDLAAQRNYQVSNLRLDVRTIGPQVVDLYRHMMRRRLSQVCSTDTERSSGSEPPTVFRSPLSTHRGSTSLKRPSHLTRLGYGIQRGAGHVRRLALALQQDGLRATFGKFLNKAAVNLQCLANRFR